MKLSKGIKDNILYYDHFYTNKFTTVFTHKSTYNLRPCKPQVLLIFVNCFDSCGWELWEPIS